MKSRKIIIHVGLQKTATTYFQQRIFPQLDDFLYIGRPYTQENHAFNAMQYADNSIYAPSVLQDEIKRIADAANGRSILISDELFSGFTFYNFINRGIIAERLSKVVPDAEILLFLRGQTDLILSLYNQIVKRGNFDKDLNESFLWRPGRGFSLDMWMDGKKDWDEKNRSFNSRSVFSTDLFRYSGLYFLYSSLFKRVHVVLYEELENNYNQCMERIEAILSSRIPKDQVNADNKGKGRINRSIEGDALWAKLMQNKLSHISSGFNLRLWRLFLRGMAVMMPDKKEEYRTHVTACLEDSDIFTDNYKLNERFGLGMEKYPHKYFGNDSGKMSDKEIS